MFTFYILSLRAHTIHRGMWALIILGELNKWVPMSRQRVTSVALGEPAVNIEITGASLELVSLTYSTDGVNTRVVRKRLDAAGFGTVVIPRPF